MRRLNNQHRLLFISLCIGLSACQASSQTLNVSQIKASNAQNAALENDQQLLLTQYADLTQEYGGFKTQALTQAYLERKVRKWVNENKASQLVRELDFARIKHPALMQTIAQADTDLLSDIMAFEAITTKQSENPTFDVFIDSLHGIYPATFSAFAPLFGAPGHNIVLTGSHFTGASAVSFNGTAASSFTVDSDSQITAVVPAEASDGLISITTPAGVVSNEQAFDFLYPSTISSFSPLYGDPGNSIVLTGTHFTGATAVSFNGTAASSFTVDSDSQLTAIVPAGASDGPLSVTTPAGVVSSVQTFNLVEGYIITTIAGTGVTGFSGDNGPASSAQLYSPNGVSVDSAGNLYIADTNNHRIRKVATNGVITTVAGAGTLGYSGDNGPATSAQLKYPSGVSIDSVGNLYIADTSNHRIRKVATNGVITTIAGAGTAGYSGDNGPATSAQINNPTGVSIDSAGNLYIADRENHRIRKVATNGMITTVAGTGASGYSGDNGPATSAKISSPNGVEVDRLGNIYIAALYNHRIRKVAANGVITTVAGTGVFGYSGDGGPATGAQLYTPRGVSVDSAGNLYIVDFTNSRIRKVATTGTITTLAGNGTAGYLGDNGAAANAQLNYPYGVCIDSAGNLYIADHGNHRIRKLTPQ